MLQYSGDPGRVGIWYENLHKASLAQAPGADDLERALNESELFGRMGLRVRMERGRDWEVLVEIPALQAWQRGGTFPEAVNGGILALLSDVAVGCTAALHYPGMGHGSGVGRLEIKMRRPSRGDSITARARAAGLKRNLVYVYSETVDAMDNVCVRTTGTVFVKSRPRPSG